MTTATKAGGAVLPVVAWRSRYISGPGMLGHYPWHLADRAKAPTRVEGYEHEALTPHAPAQATIDELRAEVERLTKERDESREHLARCEGLLAVSLKSDENSARRALKAKQIDVDAVMRLAEEYAEQSFLRAQGEKHAEDAAREALLQSLQR